MKKLPLLLLITLFAAPICAQQLIKSVIAKSVKSNEPVLISQQFKKGERAYCWIKYQNGKIGQSMSVDWFRDGVLVYTSKVAINYTTARTYTYKTLRTEGIWKAVVKASDGQILKTMTIACGARYYDQLSSDIDQSSKELSVEEKNDQPKDKNTNSTNTATTLVRCTLAKGIQSGKPTTETTKFDKNDRAYCWISYTQGEIGKKLSVEWYYNDALHYTSRPSIGYTSSSTYTYKTLRQEGNWKMVLKAPNGAVLKTIKFTAGTNDGKVKWTAPTNYTKDTLPPSIFLYPENYDPTKKYPVLIALPATFSDGTYHLSRYIGFWRNADIKTKQAKFYDYMKLLYPKASDREKHAFIVMLTTGIGTTADHTWQGFTNCITRYDVHIQTNLKRLPSADLSQIYLTGFSLGGDVSWALINKYPKRFKGIIAAGTRCSATKVNNLSTIKKNGARVYLGMGENERADRIKGMEWAVGSLKKHQIPYVYYRIPKAAHVSIDAATYQKAIRYTMAGIR